MDKKHVKAILRSIKKAFEIADTSQEYENLCECVFYSDCRLERKDFKRLKELVC